MPAAVASRAPQSEAARTERGMALILAILALLLLTFLGLTLTTTSSTEMQIANNFKWSQQALYNAEAGLEAARRMITLAGGPNSVLPPARANAWDPSVMSPPQPLTPTPLPRDMENGPCDQRGNGAGYGLVLNTAADGRQLEVTQLFGAPLDGAVTIWVRRHVETLGFPGYGARDNLNTANFVITVEGVAPSLASPNRATRIIESIATSGAGGGPCEGGGSVPQASQTGFFAECPAP